MTRLTDYQKSRVYRWESASFPKGAFLPFDQIEAYVKRVWKKEGLSYPPLVVKLHGNCRALGTGSRQYVRFPNKGAHEITILHELAHAMTGTIHGHCDAHGPQFVGVYVWLLFRHMGIPTALAWYAAKMYGVEYDMFAKAWVK